MRSSAQWADTVSKASLDSTKSVGSRHLFMCTTQPIGYPHGYARYAEMVVAARRQSKEHDVPGNAISPDPKYG